MSKQFYIPELGDKIKLAEDWEFTLYPEYRNQKFASYKEAKLACLKKLIEIVKEK